MDVYISRKIRQIWDIFKIYISSFLWQQRVGFFPSCNLDKTNKKSTSDNAQISKHTAPDALFNSKTSVYKVSGIFLWSCSSAKASDGRLED